MEKEIQEKKVKNGKGKIFLIVFSVIILVLGLICGASYIYYTYLVEEEEKNIEDMRSKNNIALLDYNEKIEYGSEIHYDDLLSKLVNVDGLLENTDIKIFINDEEFTKNSSYKFEKIGTYNMEVQLSNIYEYTIITKKTSIIENSKNFELEVEDTKMPVLFGIADKEITVGDTINLLEGISAKDEVDGELEVTMEGTVDNQKAGQYKIKAYCTDKNGNVAEQEFNVTVKEKKVETPTVSTSSNTNKSNTSSTNKSTPSKSTSSSSSSSNTTSSNSSTATNDSSTKNGRLQLATAEAKRVVAKIITPGMSDYDKAYAICNYLHSNVARQTDQSNEAYKTNYGNEAYAALIMKKAACSGFCKAVTLMCNVAGLQSKHINANQWTHQWNTVLVGGEWIILDSQGGIFGGTVHPLQGY